MAVLEKLKNQLPHLHYKSLYNHCCNLTFYRSQLFHLFLCFLRKIFFELILD